MTLRHLTSSLRTLSSFGVPKKYYMLSSVIVIGIVIAGVAVIAQQPRNDDDIQYPPQHTDDSVVETPITDEEPVAAPTTVPPDPQPAAQTPPQPAATLLNACPKSRDVTTTNIPLPPTPASQGRSWCLAFHDEFDGTALDTTKFSPCFDWNYGDCSGSFNNGKEWYYPSQVRLGGGMARLVAEPLSPPANKDGCYRTTCTYKAGLLSTSRPRADNRSGYLYSFTYGYIESRMRFPGEPGFFTAFWMLPADPSYSYRSEIDIVEILGGHPDTIFMNYHYANRSESYSPNQGLHNNGACPAKDYSRDFVTFGLDWQPSYIAWYIDGVKCGQFDGNTASIESGPMQVILHLMVDNDWERDWDSVLRSQDMTEQLEVDYLRIYQQK